MSSLNRALSILLDLGVASADYHWKEKHGLHISDHGSMDIDMEGFSCSFGMLVGESNGRPTVHTTGDVKVSVHKIKIKFHGKVSWIYNTLEGLFRPLIEHAIKKDGPKVVENLVNNVVEGALAKLNVVVPFKSVTIDMSMLAPPTYAADLSNFTIALRGLFQDRQHPAPCPWQPGTLPMPHTALPVHLLLSDYVLNCASSVYFEQGVIALNVTNSMLGANSTLLNTATFKHIVPKMYDMYPNDNMTLSLAARNAPLIKASPAGLQLAINGLVNATVLVPSNTSTALIPTPAFSLGAGASLVLLPHINSTTPTNSSVSLRMVSLACNVTLVSSEVGHLDIGLLNILVEKVCKSVIPPAFNALMPALRIPSLFGISLVKPTLALGTGFMDMAGGVQYDPHSGSAMIHYLLQ